MIYIFIYIKNYIKDDLFRLIHKIDTLNNEELFLKISPPIEKRIYKVWPIQRYIYFYINVFIWVQIKSNLHKIITIYKF